MSIFTDDPNNWVTNDIAFDQTQGNQELKEKYENIQEFFRTGWIPADQTWTFDADDDPTYTFTIAAFDATSRYSPGMRIKLTDSGTQYFIITKVVFDDPGSTITIYGGTTYDLSGGPITNPFYGIVKAPLDFSLNPDDWTEEIVDIVERTQVNPAADTWYNLGGISIDIPVGLWLVSYSVAIHVQDAETTSFFNTVTLSDANNNESDLNYSSYAVQTVSNNHASQLTYIQKIMDLATKDTFFLNEKTTFGNLTTLRIDNANQYCVLRAVCAYL